MFVEVASLAEDSEAAFELPVLINLVTLEVAAEVDLASHKLASDLFQT
jgi:hypothetical protein